MKNQDLQIGSLVWYNNSRNYFSSTFIHSSKIAKMTPGGKITLENGKSFKNGNEVKTKLEEYPCACIITEESAQREFKNTADRNRIAGLMAKMERMIGGRKCGNGRYAIDAKQELAIENFIKEFEAAKGE
jgi:hypothetical protein